MVKDQFPDAVKEATNSVLPVWLDALKTLLNVNPLQDVENTPNWDGLAIRIQVFKVCAIFMTLRPDNRAQILFYRPSTSSTPRSPAHSPHTFMTSSTPRYTTSPYITRRSTTITSSRQRPSRIQAKTRQSSSSISFVPCLTSSAGSRARARRGTGSRARISRTSSTWCSAGHR